VRTVLSGSTVIRLARTALPALAAGWFLVAGVNACVHAGPHGVESAEAPVPDLDPNAPAVPQQQTAQTSGSDTPVTVDPMLQQDEQPSQATRDYSEAFDDNPDYKQAATKARGKGSTRVVIGVPRINIRSAPNRRSRIIGDLRKGDVLMVDIDESTGWAKIREGEYIRARYLRKGGSAGGSPSGSQSRSADD